MRFECTLQLPTDVRYVPVARHFCQNAMREFGVDKACMSSVSLAITEACANVVEHSRQTDEHFEVKLELNFERCIIRVIDKGIGISDPARISGDLADPAVDADRGRGMYLMRKMVDEVRFESKPELGTVVHLEKKLTFESDPERRLVVG